MISDSQREFITLLHKWAAEQWKEAEVVEEGDLLILRMLPRLHDDGTGAVLMEVCLLEYSEEISVAQIYTTIIPEPKPGLTALREKLPRWNFASLAGAYGIYEEQGQLYHKQNVAVLRELGVDDQVEAVLTGIFAAMDEMARRLPEALAVSAGSDDGAAQ